ncbi:uncharacterized protein stbd1 [Denticeps clupeoides]|uniref:Starch-binding domain-containing protein 1 n=1 Tax=Denticeps clupeoides TaxID=299321 RepID=A0AAY4ERG4_9TELE|nr:starch-binding domain-containing protein 1 [Denticeps clupeoides]
MKKSKSAAAAGHHDLLSLTRGYGPALAVGTVAVLSLCAALLIYRSARRQRGGTSGRRAEGGCSTAAPDRGEARAEGAGGASTGKLCHSEQKPGKIPEEQNNAAASPEHLNDNVSDQRARWMETDEDLDGPVGTGTPKVFTAGCHQVIASVSCENLSKKQKKKGSHKKHGHTQSFTEQLGHEDHKTRDDLQDTSSFRVSGGDFQYYLQSVTERRNDSKKKLDQMAHLHDLTWELKTMEATIKSPEQFITGYQPQCEWQERFGMVHEHLRFPHNHAIECFESSLFKSADVAPENAADGSRNAQPEESCDKTEINIMEATMDDNEWLNITDSNKNLLSMPVSNVCGGSAVAEESHRRKNNQEESESGILDAPREAPEDEQGIKQVATVSPMSQTVQVNFCVHYITGSLNQFIAVTGSHQQLGGWTSFVPLKKSKHWIWSNTVTLPVESQIEWKFVLVEDSRICRWEECDNRSLTLSGTDEIVHLQKWWGCQ